MKRKAFTLIEIAIILAIIVLTALIVIPNLIEDNKKLDIISKWKNSYQNIEYIFTAIAAQVTDTDKALFAASKDDQEREKLLYELLNPYFRMNKKIDVKDYKTYYLNGIAVKESEDYYVTNLHELSSGKIIGIKWLNSKMNAIDTLPVALLMCDLNGLEAPNKWGYDIFGVNIFQNKIEPVGKTNDEYLLKTGCSKKGNGLACSYYYYIFGGELK